MKKYIVFLAIILVLISGCGKAADQAADMAKSEESTAYNQAADAAGAENKQLTERDMGTVDRKIIQNAEVRLRIDDIKDVSEKIKDQTIALHGYLNDYAVYTNENDANANLVLRVPGANYAKLLDFIVKQGKQEFKREYTNDVTTQYIDLDARVKVLKAEEESLLAILNKAEKIDDILKIKAQITSTRQERESLEGQLKALNNSIEYATINVTLYKPVNSDSNIHVENLNIFSRSGKALIYGFNALTFRLGNIVVFFFTALPTLALLTLIIVGILRIRKRKKKSE